MNQGRRCFLAASALAPLVLAGADVLEGLAAPRFLPALS